MWITDCFASRNHKYRLAAQLPSCPNVAVGHWLSLSALFLSTVRVAAFQGFCPHEKLLPPPVVRTAYSTYSSVARHLAATATPENETNYPSCTRSTAIIPGLLASDIWFGPPLNTHGQICDSGRLQEKNNGSQLPSQCQPVTQSVRR